MIAPMLGDYRDPSTGQWLPGDAPGGTERVATTALQTIASFFGGGAKKEEKKSYAGYIVVAVVVVAALAYMKMK